MSAQCNVAFALLNSFPQQTPNNRRYQRALSSTLWLLWDSGYLAIKN